MQTPEQNQNGITNETEKKLLQEKCKDIGIYGLKNKINGKWYIGQSAKSIEKRWYFYKKLHCKEQPNLYNALKKYGYDSFDKIVLENCTSDKNTLNERETHWINFYNSIKNGYNLKCGGQHGKVSLETRDKIRKSKLGKHRDFTTIENMRKSMNALYNGPDGRAIKTRISNSVKKALALPKTKEKMKKAALSRKPMSNETRMKCGEASKLYWASKKKSKN